MAPPSDQKPTFGVSVVRANAPNSLEIPRAPPSIFSTPDLTPVVSHEALSEKPIPPHSPFYQHPPASFERVHSRENSKQNISVHAFEKDIEAQSLAATPLATHDDNPFTSKVSVDCNKECRMWPSRQTLVQTKREHRNNRRQRQFLGGCVPMRQKWERCTKKQRLLIQLALALLVVGIMVAIGVGISKAVNGSVYSTHGQQPIGDDDNNNN